MTPQWYEALSTQAEKAFVHGELEQACTLLEQAHERALTEGLDELSYECFCRKCSILIELGEDVSGDEARSLKEIVLRSGVAKTRWMAANNVAISHYLEKEYDKAHSYWTRAAVIAEEIGDNRSVATSLNNLGNLALVNSRFDEAEPAYQRALVLCDGSDDEVDLLSSAQFRNNLGYVMICTDRFKQGIALCEEARQDLERLQADYCLPQLLQDLCYGYLLTDRLQQAQTCGEQGLVLAMRFDDTLVAKNLHYLLAEVAVRSGDRFRASRYLTALTDFYPELPAREEIVDLLMGVDFTQVVNLRG